MGSASGRAGTRLAFQAQQGGSAIGTAQQITDKLGEFLYRHQDPVGLDRFEEYEEDPVSFAREVLGVELWAKQREVVESVAQNRQTVVLGGHGVGKDVAGACAALWVVYARGMLVLVTASVRRTAESVFLQRELAPIFREAPVDLPGDLYQRKLQVPGTEAEIRTMTGTGASSLTGFHHGRGVLTILSEAQDVPDHAWEAMAANRTSEHGRALVLGNPVRAEGKFYEVAHQTNWHRTQIPVFEHPNLQEGKAVIPGGPSEAWVKERRKDWGPKDPRYRGRVKAEFPESHSQGLVRASWIREAAERYGDWEFYEDLEEELTVLAVDVSLDGPAETIACLRAGRHVIDFLAIEGNTTPEIARRVYDVAKTTHNDEYSQLQRIVVDGLGVGAGVHGALKEMPALTRMVRHGRRRIREVAAQIVPYKGSRAAHFEDRFANLRTQAYWHLRERLQEGEIALPPEPDLTEELMRTRWELGPDDRLAIEPKRKLESRLGRSPDRLDALAMAYARMKENRPPPPVVF